MTKPTIHSALILAGKRAGQTDPLAIEAGVTHKCLVPVDGKPMLLHVFEALAGSANIGKIDICFDDAVVLFQMNELRASLDSGRAGHKPVRFNLVDSIVSSAADVAFPLLITTADNVNLTADAVDEFLERCMSSPTDAAVAFARRDAVLSAHPDGQRRFYRFADDSYSNCNTYWLRTPDALSVAETFREGGQFAKYPRRIIAAFGLINLIRFRFGIGTLEEAFQRFSRRFKIKIRPIILSDGAVAIDVDNATTLSVAAEIMSERKTFALSTT